MALLGAAGDLPRLHELGRPAGGIGENAWYVREAVLVGLSGLGVKLDKKKNKKVVSPEKAIAIHARNSKVKIYVIPANEEQQRLDELVKVR